MPAGVTFSPAAPSFFENAAQGTKLNAIHLNLIPKGPNQGKVLVWTDYVYCGNPAGETRVLYWSIVDPVAQTFENDLYYTPQGEGDIFCAGHAWLPDGRLLVAGGTLQHAEQPECGPVDWSGAELAYLFDPAKVYDPANPDTTTPWRKQLEDLEKGRWYPSVVLLGGHPVTGVHDALVAGGLRDNTYEEFVPPTSLFVDQGSWRGFLPPFTQVWPGPLASCGSPGSPCWELQVYPRMHLLSDGRVVTAGFRRGSVRADPYAVTSPGVSAWETVNTSWMQSVDRFYGSSVLFPISLLSDAFDVVVTVGGLNNAGPGSLELPTNSVEKSDAKLVWPANGWQALAPLNHARRFHNLVLLPDSTLLVLGGEASRSQGCSESPVKIPELLVGGQWSDLEPDTIIRQYHSTALLLPSGKVLTAGGDWRGYYPEPGNCPTQTPVAISGASDYRVFAPPYLDGSPLRPVLTSVAPPGGALVWTLSQFQQPASIQTVTFDPDSLPFGAEIAKVVLVRAGSVTHHADPNQRLCSLKFTYASGTNNTLNVTIPDSSNVLPRGYYMLFLVSSLGTPSVATWVQVQ